MLVALIGIGAGEHVLHAVHQEHAFVQPIGRRVEREARDHLVVIAEHRNHRPIGDVLADPNVHPFDRVGDARVQSERRILVGADRATSGSAISGGAFASSSASRSFCLRTRPGSRIASTISIDGHQDREPARVAMPACQVGLRPLEIRFGLGCRGLGLGQALLHLRRRRHAGRNLRAIELGDGGADGGARARDILAPVANDIRVCGG